MNKLSLYARFLLFILTISGVFLTESVQSQYAIGHTTITFNDPTRTGGFGSGGGPGRQIQTEIYYPADAAGTSVAVSDGEFPVIVFGHGFAMSWDAYTNIWQELVPRGYILAFPRTEGGLLPAPSHQDFGLDLAVVTERMLLEGEEASSIFFEHIHENAAIAGHSMGGGATMIGANGNTNIKTIVGLAPAETNPSAVTAAAGIDVPALIMSASSDAVTPPDEHHEPIYEALNSECKYFVSINGGAHCYYANTNFNCDFGEGSSGGNITITRTEQQQITYDYLNAWFDYMLKGECSAFNDFIDLIDNDTRTTSINECELDTPVISTNDELSICEGESITISVDDVNDIEWSTGETGISITVTEGGVYYAFNTITCQKSNELEVVVTEEADASWAAPSGICSDNVINLNDLITGDAGGTWSGQGVSGSDFDPEGLSGSIEITYTVGSGSCTDEQSNTIEVLEKPETPEIIVTGNVQLCEGESVVLSVDTDLPVVWSTGETGNSIEVTESGTYAAQIAASDECVSDFSDDVTVTVVTSPSAAWDTPGVLCENAPAIDLNDLVTGTSGGTWFGDGVSGSMFDPSGLDGSVELTYSVGSGDCADELAQVITVVDSDVSADWTAPNQVCESEPIDLDDLVTGTQGGIWSGQGVSGNTFDPSGLSGSIAITYTVGSGDCSEVSTQQIEVVDAPDAPVIDVSGSTDLCEGESLTLSVNTTMDVIWSTGESGTSITVTEAGYYSAQVSASGACISMPSAAVDVTLIPLPDASWNTPGALCEQEGSVNLNDFVTGQVGGTWSGQGVSGASFNPAGLSGTTVSVTYTVTNNGCTSSSSQNIAIEDEVSAAWTNPGVLCGNDLIDLNSLVTGTMGGTWSGQGVSGSTFNPQGLSGTIQITYSVGTGDCSDELTRNLSVFGISTPEIVLNGGVLTCTVTAHQYQWYYEGTAIPGANAQTHQPANAGNYTVVISYDNGCEEESDIFFYEPTSVQDDAFASSFKMYPNPSSDQVFIELNGLESGHLRVFSLEGRLVEAIAVQSTMINIDVTNFPKGLYLVSFVNMDGVTLRTEKLVVQ
jgi:predicted dienelactone hydrolase